MMAKDLLDAYGASIVPGDVIEYAKCYSSGITRVNRYKIMQIGEYGEMWGDDQDLPVSALLLRTHLSSDRAGQTEILHGNTLSTRSRRVARPRK